MSNPDIPESQPTPETSESFDSILLQFEQSHSRKANDGGRQLEGTVITVTAEHVFLDIGYKVEGVLPLAAFASASPPVQPGDRFPVTVKGRDEEGYYELSLFAVKRPTDWSSLEQAFAEKATIAGMVSSVVKGGLSVDVGVRAFMPASRSGARDAAGMEALVGQEIRCRITKLDVADEDVVVDRRVVLEEEERSTRERRYSEIREGETVHGTVHSLTEYGAFVDLGGVDALLHVGEISWSHIDKASDVLSVGQEIEVKVLKVDPEKRRISVGLKQLQPHPWDAGAGKYTIGERVHGLVTRVLDFGAFVELEPGIEGLIHLSEMSWARKVRKPSDILKPGDRVEAVILGVSVGERRISLGLKQALGDPWVEVAKNLRVGSVIEGPVVSFIKFGAFVQVAEGVEGMIHVSEITAEKRVQHPQDVLKAGQIVKAQVLEVDRENRQLRLSIKQMIPVSLDEYIAEHKQGDVVTGRIVEIVGTEGRVELGEGIEVNCEISDRKIGDAGAASKESKNAAKADLSSLTSMLQARWKNGAAAGPPKPDAVHAGQVRSFRIAKLDAGAKRIELELF
jgi:small subunit ribosomal protein S1